MGLSEELPFDSRLKPNVMSIDCSRTFDVSNYLWKPDWFDCLSIEQTMRVFLLLNPVFGPEIAKLN